MEEITRKGPGRPRKSVDVPAAAAQAAATTQDDDGDGETRPAGAGAQAQLEGEGAWNVFVTAVKHKASIKGRSYCTVTHPAPIEPVISAEWDIAVEVGPLMV